ncbi:MAG: rod shape-determining protein MreC [Actinomycetota bacterium]|nr:rod shape-determining protein MreC [Actinomycetota bacterium]
MALRSSRTTRNRFILVVIFIVCVALITLYVRESDSGPVHKIQKFFTDLISPITSVITKVTRPIKDGFVNLWHLPTLSREKSELERELNDLRRQVLESKALEEEVADMKKLLSWSEKNTYETAGASIVAQSPDNWQRIMIISRGSSSGIKKYMSVVNEEGLIGRVISAGSDSSVVQLLTDSRSGIGARCVESRETGIVEGYNSSNVRFVPMNDEATVKLGDTIETSGLGGTCPSGIAIGRVVKVEPARKGHARRIEVKPFVKISKLDNVLVILTPEPESIILKETE